MNLRFNLVATVGLALAFPVLCPAASYSVTDLGTLGGTFSTARGINATGQVVGEAFIANDASVHAFFYSAGVVTDLGSLGGPSSGAFAINDASQITGYATTPTDTRAFLYSGGAMTDLGTLGGRHSWGFGINNAGQVVVTGVDFLYQGL